MIYGMDICLKTKSSLCGAYNNALKDFTCFQGSVHWVQYMCLIVFSAQNSDKQLLPALHDFFLKKTRPVQCLDQMLKIQT